MDVESLAKQLILKGMTEEQQNAVLESIKTTMGNARTVQKQRIGENVQVVVQALKKIEADIKSRYDETGKAIEKRVASIKNGRDGRDGVDGRAGKDGRPGRDGAVGPRGIDGLNGSNGIDGVDGISITDAHIDFDGSLIITLSDGKLLNVGEVVSQDIAEKIKVIQTMSTNGAVGISDEGSSISTGVKNINFVGAAVTASASGDDVTVNVSAGTGTVTSVAVSGGTTGLTTSGGPITTTGTITLGGTLAVASGGTGTATPGLVAGTNITSITGSWPNQTINAGGGSGTVTSVAATVPAFLSVTGSPITTSGTLAIGLSGSALPVANGGTGVTTSTGTTNVVLSNSPTLVTPALGTPSSATLTNATGLPIATGVSGLGTGVATFLATPSSANLASAVTDETGSGSLVFATSPTLITPALGTPASGVVTNLTGTASININGTVGATTPAAGAFTTLSATGVTTVQAGTAALPAITTTGDTNTGIWFPAGDTIAFTEGGVESMRINSSGNMGIGTTTPQGRLNLSNAGAAGFEFFVNSPSAGVGTYIQSFNRSGGAYVETHYYAASHTFRTDASATTMVLNTSGNVGIGTSSPSSILNVKAGTPILRLETAGAVGSGAVAYNAIRDSTGSDVFVNGFLGLANCYQFATTAAAGFMRFLTGAQVEAMRIDSSGNVGIGTSTPSTKLTVVAATNAGIAVNDGTVNTIIYNSTGGVSSIGTTTNHPVDFYSNNAARMRLDTSGNLLFNSGYGSVATAYGCRAWVNFNGTGTVAIRASGNVSSITDNGTGNYTVNLTTAMPDANFCVCASGGDPGTRDGGVMAPASQALTTSTVRVRGFASNALDTPYDLSVVSVAIFR